MKKPESILSFHEVTFQLSNMRQPFFKNINLHFKRGCLHRIAGKNGVGKTLFFRLIQGIFFKNEKISGTISFNGIPYTLSSQESLPTIYRSSIAALPQKFDNVLADSFSGEENLKCSLIGRYPKLTSLPEYNRLPEFFKTFTIDLTKPVHLLSGGQRQIIAILMMLQKPKSMLLLDEPTAALDNENARLVMQFLEELIAKTGITIFLISHEDESFLPSSTINHTIILDLATGIRNFIVE